MSKVVILGTASFAEVVHYYLTHESEHEVVAFTANQDRITVTEVEGLPVVPLETLEHTHPPSQFKLFIAVGYTKVNQVRARLYHEAKQKSYEMITFISPNCNYKGESIGDNCFIFEDNTVQPFVNIGNNVIMWSGNHIGHHSTIGDHCFISSHVVVSGHVRVGAYCFFGVNATLRDSISIGESCIIGAGALIMRDTLREEVYIETRTRASKLKAEDLNF